MHISPHVRRLAAVILALIAFGVTATVIWAHPLGNFTINHYARLEIAQNQIRIRFVMDYAEIPTFQEKQNMDTDANGTISDAGRLAYLQSHLPTLVSNLQLTVNGQAVPLQVEQNSEQLELLPGTGGLEIMHISAWLDAPVQINNATQIHFQDNNYQERIGWRELLAKPGQGVQLTGSNITQQDVSQELSNYPADLLSNPRNDREANLTVALGSGTSVSTNAVNALASSPLGVFERTRDDFAKLITTDQELTIPVLALMFLFAIGLGGLHAFSPGHGKAVVGSYLVGSRGNWQHAVFLGLVVTATHTIGVYALGAVTLFLSAYIFPEQLFPYLEFISGMLVAIIGVRLLIERIRFARSGGNPLTKIVPQVKSNAALVPALATAGVAPSVNGHVHGEHVHQFADPHVHTHADGTSHSHSHEHETETVYVHTHEDRTSHSHSHNEDAHEHGHTHSHNFATPEEEAAHAREHLAAFEKLEKPSWRNLLSLGISGGLLPCPSALVVMLSAIALGRVLLGFYLIIGFSLGLAGVLVGTGLLLLYAGKVAGRFFAGKRMGLIFRWVPIVGAALVTLLGIAIALSAFFQTGLNL